jgi:mannose-6-phosphate isomerase-like protein (cupin superfamily)
MFLISYVQSGGRISEVILEGEALMTIEAEQSRVGPGRVILIPPGFWQQIRNIGSDDLKFLCIVYPYWRREDDEVRW